MATTTPNPLKAIPALYRKYVYIAYGTAALVAGGLSVAFTVDSTGSGLPHWLKVYLAVLAYLGAPVGAVAGSNVGPGDTPPPAPKA